MSLTIPPSRPVFAGGVSNLSLLFFVNNYFKCYNFWILCCL